MKIEHNCNIVLTRLTHGISKVTRRWICPECGQHWQVIQRPGGNSEASRMGASGLKNWRWQRKMRKELK